MQAEDARTLVIRVWEAWSSRDEDRISRLFHDDAVWTAPDRNPTAVYLDCPNVMVGGDAIAKFVAREMYRMFKDPEVEFLGVHADGPIVVVEERMTAALPTGRTYCNEYIFVFACHDGRVSSIREYMDTAKANRQVFGDDAIRAQPARAWPLWDVPQSNDGRNTPGRRPAPGDESR